METADNVLFTCPQYINQRNCLEKKMGFQITPDDIVHLMLTSIDNWNAVCIFERRVLIQQRLAEREMSAKLNLQPEVILDCDAGVRLEV